MKKKIKQLMGVMLLSALFFGCSNPGGDSGNNSGDNPTNPQIEEFTVTFDFGEYGVSINGKSKETVKVTKDDYVDECEIVIKNAYAAQLTATAVDWYTQDNQYFWNAPITKDTTFYARYTAAPVKNLKATVEESKITFTWDTISNSKYYYTCGGISGSTDTASYSIDKEDNVNTYNFNVYRKSTLSNNILSSNKVSTAIKTGITESDWLVLMYMDGDNNLNDVLYLDLNEAESGLSKNSNIDNVTVVALWDGWDFKTNNGNGDVSSFDYISSDFNVHNTASTRLLELAPDSNPLYTSNGGYYFKALELSPNTLDLTNSASWITNGEVNMGSEETLENFLKWAAENYSAENIILQFSNHGGGPRFAKNNNRRRSMCWDETSGGNGFIKTSDVSKALEAAGYGTDKKVKLIMEDVCLGGSIEESYELKDYAEYYVGSPNNIPGMGFDYISFISSLTSTATIEEVGSKLIASYKSFYEMTSDDWKEILADEDYAYLNNLDELYKSLYYAGSTLSFVDLSKVNAVKEAVNSFASFILTEGTSEDNRIKVYNNTFYDSENDDVPEGAVAVTKLQAVKYWTAFYNEPIYYEGTFGNLKDLGFMMAILNSIYNDESWLGISAKTKAVQNALDAAIIACWRDGYNGKPTYYKNPLGSSTAYLSSDLGLGLTINCAVWVPYTQNGNNYYTSGSATWYKNELAFGTDCENWTTLIQTWFPYTGNN